MRRIIYAVGLIAILALPCGAPSPLFAESGGKNYYMRIEDPDDPDGTVSFTDNPPRYDQWDIFIRGGPSRSGSRFRDFFVNRNKYDETIKRLSDEQDVPAALIKAVVMAESAFNPNARSRTGAQGLMQLIPGTARLVGCTDPLDPDENLAGGTRYLKMMLMRFKGDTRRAVAAYNAGPGAVERYGGIPPYDETRYYVRRVLSLYEDFRSNGLTIDRR